MLIIAVVLVLLNTYPVVTSQDLVFRSKQSTLQAQTGVVASALVSVGNLTEDSVGQVMALLDDDGVTRLLVTDPMGRVLYDSSRPQGGGEPRYALIREVVQALEGNKVFTSRFDQDAFGSRAATPIVYRNEVIGSVFLYEEDREQGALLLGLQSDLRTISLVVAAVVVVGSLLASRLLTRRLGELLGAIRIVREGKLDHRAEIKGKDELDQLASEFNDLTDRLRHTEEVRRRFVSDASHELKTPLASIRLLSDSILQTRGMDETMTREFVQDIGEEAERLTRITENLLQLTRLEGDAPAVREPVELQAVAEKVRRMLEPLAQAKTVSLRTELEPVTVAASEDQMIQVVFNLMENAVKYNQPGGLVECRLRRDGEWAELTVEDTGIGIPEEELPRIFERFYRVDKARSRETGGTGLGLSIVWDTVNRYGGTIRAQRREAGGSRFVLRLPAGEGELP